MWTTEVELAHDLRMPLQLISSSAQMLKQSLDDPSLDGRAYADILLSSVDQLQRLLGGALAGEKPRFKNADITARVRQLCQSCRPYAEQRGVALRYAANTGTLLLALDEELLSRALLNLISNALRFTPAGGEIRVELAALGDFVEISVVDSGAGISPQRQTRVFQWGESEGGHGYGLPIARRCARALGGELTLRSAPGQGSAFTLRLPVRSVDAG
ncbi:MAG: HAMP domain-containing histidine kinase [Clostridia bacterium]|nr:HAMP domain-containing histidine kinase [Clostridia bacterium]